MANNVLPFPNKNEPTVNELSKKSIDAISDNFDASILDAIDVFQDNNKSLIAIDNTMKNVASSLASFMESLAFKKAEEKADAKKSEKMRGSASASSTTMDAMSASAGGGLLPFLAGGLIFGGIKSALTKLFDPKNILKAFKAAFKLAAVVGSVINAITGGITGFLNSDAETLAGKIADGLRQAIGNVLEFLTFGLIETEDLPDISGKIDAWAKDFPANFINFINDTDWLGGIKNVVNAVSDALGFTELAKALGLENFNPGKSVVDGIESVLDAFGIFSQSISAYIGKTKAAFSQMFNGASEFFDHIVEKITTGYNTVLEFVNDLLAWNPMESISNLNISEKLKDGFNQAVSTAKSAITSFFSNSFSSIEAFFTGLLDKVSSFSIDIGDFANPLNSVGVILNDVMQGLAKQLDSKFLPDSISEGISNLGVSVAKSMGADSVNVYNPKTEEIDTVNLTDSVDGLSDSDVSDSDKLKLSSARENEINTNSRNEKLKNRLANNQKRKTSFENVNMATSGVKQANETKQVAAIAPTIVSSSSDNSQHISNNTTMAAAAPSVRHAASPALNYRR